MTEGEVVRQDLESLPESRTARGTEDLHFSDLGHIMERLGKGSRSSLTKEQNSSYWQLSLPIPVPAAALRSVRCILTVHPNSASIGALRVRVHHAGLRTKENKSAFSL